MKNTESTSWEGDFDEKFFAKDWYWNDEVVKSFIRTLLSKERAEGERRGAERCVVILEKYLNADEVVRNGQRFLVIDGADVPYGYPYPDNRLKYALRAITTLPADSTEDTTNLTT